MTVTPDEETEIIRKVLQTVQEKEQRRIAEGLNKRHFSLGVMNSLLVAYVMGAFPQHFWLLYLTECSIYIPLKIYRDAQHQPLSRVLYYLDYCWIMNFVMMGLLYLVALFPGLVSEEMRHHVLAAVVGTCTGALVVAMVALSGNALVFHDAPTLTSLWIHLTPPMNMYTILYHADDIREAWPEIFHIDSTIVERVKTHFFPPQSGPFYWPLVQGLGTVHGNATALYVIWWILYVAWQLAIGLDLPRQPRRTLNKQTGQPLPAKYDTVFHVTVRKGLCQLIGTVCWKRPKEISQRQMAHNDFEVRDFFVYMFFHALGVWGIGLTLVSHACCQSQRIYATVVWLLVGLAVYRGAEHYVYYVTEMCSQAVQKEFPEVLEKKSK